LLGPFGVLFCLHELKLVCYVYRVEISYGYATFANCEMDFNDFERLDEDGILIQDKNQYDEMSFTYIPSVQISLDTFGLIGHMIRGAIWDLYRQDYPEIHKTATEIPTGAGGQTNYGDLM
jgi:hypothetical protein